MSKDGWLSVSDVISFPSKPFLMNWARKLALQGIDFNRVSTLGKYAGRIMHWEFQQRYGNSLEPMGKDVQEAKNNFCSRFAKASDHWLADWRNEIVGLSKADR